MADTALAGTDYDISSDSQNYDVITDIIATISIDVMGEYSRNKLPMFAPLDWTSSPSLLSTSRRRVFSVSIVLPKVRWRNVIALIENPDEIRRILRHLLKVGRNTLSPVNDAVFILRL